MPDPTVSRSSLIELDGTLVRRLGYGTMRLTGPGVLGPPADLAGARRVLSRALELGVRVFDTAWYYGPDIPNQLLADAIRACPDHVVVATKLGWNSKGGGSPASAHTPEQLRMAMARDLRLLVRERIVAGDTDAQVLAFVEARYGEFVLLRPPFKLHTLALWLTPLLLLIGTVLVLRRNARTRNAAVGERVVPLSDAEKKRLDDLLGKGS